MPPLTFHYLGPFLVESDFPGESKRDFATPNYATGMRLSPDRWLIVYDTVDCRGADFWRSVMYQVREGSPLGAVRNSGVLAQRERVATPLGKRYPCWRGYGNPNVFGVPLPASGDTASPAAGIVAISWNSRCELWVKGRFVQHAPGCPWPADVSAESWRAILAEIGAPRMLQQFRFNPATDALDPLAPAEPSPDGQARTLRRDLQGTINWGNPVPRDARGLSWLEALTDAREESLLSIRRYDFDRASGRFRMAPRAMEHREPPSFQVGEPSLARLGANDWMVAARCFGNGGKTLLYRTPDPWEGLGKATELETTFGQRMLHRFAEGSVRLTLNHRTLSPYKDRRNPLYCFRLDPSSKSVLERDTVFDARAAGLAFAMPFVDHAHLFEPHRPGAQLLTFRLITQRQVWWHDGAPALTAEERRLGGIHACEARFDADPSLPFCPA